MDFKVAGTRNGITAIQMDIKIKGISFAIMEEALNRAREGRMHILDIMDKTIDKPREEISEYAPRIMKIKIPVDKIGAVIGPSGKNIRSIIDKTGASIDIDDDGTTLVASPNVAAAKEAIRLIELMTVEPKIGEYYRGKVKRITNFGAFVEIAPGVEGMIHISEMDTKRTNQITDIVNVGDQVDVLIKKVDRDGKIGLSRKDYLIKNQKREEQSTQE